MPYDLFWHGDRYCYKIYRDKLRIDSNKQNEEAWLYGYYIFNAVTVAIHNKFRQKGETTAEYPKEPYRIDRVTKEEKAEEKRQYVEKMRKMLEGMKASYDARSKNGTT